MKIFSGLLLVLCLAAQQSYAAEWSAIKPMKIGPRTYVIEHGPHDEDQKISRGAQGRNPGRDRDQRIAFGPE